MNKRVDDMLEEIVQICRLGAQPGGTHLLEILYPGTREAVQKVMPECPLCGWPHPGDVPCKPGERKDYSGV